MGGHDALWGWLLNNRGAMRLKQGRLAEALDDIRRAVSAKEKTGGVNNPDVAVSLNNLALWLVLRGEMSEAVAPIERALMIVERGLGAEHPMTGIVSSNCADVFNSVGRFSEAHRAAARALAILEPGRHPEDLSLASPLAALGVACLGMGQADQALPLLERAVAIRDLKENDPVQLGDARFALARALAAVGRDRPRARALAERARSDYARAGETPVGARALVQIDAWLAGSRPAPSAGVGA
jgi:tetratricopeptide (TPR) repeat protein